jgi:hypothetical protein
MGYCRQQAARPFNADRSRVALQARERRQIERREHEWHERHGIAPGTFTWRAIARGIFARFAGRLVLGAAVLASFARTITFGTAIRLRLRSIRATIRGAVTGTIPFTRAVSVLGTTIGLRRRSLRAAGRLGCTVGAAISLARGIRTAGVRMRMASAMLDHAAQFLHLLGKVAKFVLHLLQCAGRSRRSAASHGRREAAADWRFRFAVGALRLALGLLTQFAHHFLQVLGRLIDASGAEVLNGLGEVVELAGRVAAILGPAIVVVFGRTAIRTLGRRLVGASIRTLGVSRGRENEGGSP